jgi:hypothetical protein
MLLLRCSCRLKQLRTSWQQNPDNAPVVARLSEPCRDLLDKMFDTNQVRACTAAPGADTASCNGSGAECLGKASLHVQQDSCLLQLM